jgi:predicted esterase
MVEGAEHQGEATVELDLRIPVPYILEKAPGSKRGILLLHGYNDRANSARRRVFGAKPLEKLTLFAPNGIFPAPVRIKEQHRIAYAWYFRDGDSGLQMSSPEFGADGVMQMIAKLGLQDHSWIVVGFSQGGFLAPYLLNAGLRADSVIAIGAAYRLEAYQLLSEKRDLSTVTLHAIHGDIDQIIGLDRAKSSYEVIQGLGVKGSFNTLKGVGHTLDVSGQDLVQKLITEL